jgi:hypothetical protein
MTAYDHELTLLEDQLAEGFISLAEFNDGVRALEREMRADAQERAELAYRNELES